MMNLFLRELCGGIPLFPSSILLFLAITFIFQPVLLAQTTATYPGAGKSTLALASPPVLNVTSHAVVLDVVVTDSHNRPLRGLEKQDFSVFEDGRQQNIAFFEANDASSGAQDLPRTIVLIDQLNTGAVDSAYVLYSVKKFLRESGTRLQQPTALMTFSDQGLSAVGGFTQDPAVLEGELAHLPTELPVRLREGRLGALERIDMSLGALREIAQANQSSGRHQVVVWISRGFPVFAGVELHPEQEQQLLATLRTLSKQLLDGRITLYTVDPTGSAQISLADRIAQGTSLADLSDAKRVSFADAALQVIAVQTGGQAFFGRNNIDHEVASSIADGSSFYTISYDPSNLDFDGSFRKITVAVNRPGVSVQTREGYYALPQPPPPTQEQLETQVQQALATPLTYTSIPVAESGAQIWTNPSLGRFQFVVAGRAVNWVPQPDGSLQCKLIVGAADLSEPGQPPAHFAMHAVAVSFPADKLDALLKGSFHVSIDLPVQQPLHRVRFVVSDLATGLVGSTDITGFPVALPGGPAQGLKQRN
jgi:VWFA-related protein